MALDTDVELIRHVKTGQVLLRDKVTKQVWHCHIWGKPWQHVVVMDYNFYKWKPAKAITTKGK